MSLQTHRTDALQTGDGNKHIESEIQAADCWFVGMRESIKLLSALQVINRGCNHGNGEVLYEDYELSWLMDEVSKLNATSLCY